MDSKIALSDTDSDALLRPDGRANPNRSRPIALAIVCTSVFWWLFFSFHGEIIWHTKPTVTLSCGNSTAEARALGCRFDTLSFLWVPGPCFDEELNEAYQKSVNWHGYNDADGKEMLDLETMSERVMPFEYFTTGREHAVHCAYMWQRQHKGYLQGGLYLDDNSISFHHTRHCSEVLMQAAELPSSQLDLLTTVTTVGFSSCIVAR